MAGAMDWNDDEVGRLKELWAEGLSCSQIGAKLGCSRNAVIGKVHRLKLGGRAAPAKPKKAPKVVRLTPPKLRNTGGARKVAAIIQVRKKGPLPPPGPPLVVDVTKARPWTERTFGECAYIVHGDGADAWSCCAATAGRYCLPHRALMFVPPKKKIDDFAKYKGRAVA